MNVRGRRSVSIPAEIHEVEAPAGLLIEKKFYLDFGKNIPEGLHHEMELVEIESWRPTNSSNLHIHQSKINGRQFVCWPKQIPSLAGAIMLFKVWCVGTIYTLETGNDFGPLFDGKNREGFCEHMKSNFDIFVTGYSSQY